MSKSKKRNKIQAFDIINMLILVFIAVACFYPFWNVLVYSFNDGIDALRGALFLWPRVFTVQNYMAALTTDGILNAFFVSVLRTLAGTLLTLICTSSLAYVMTKRDLPGYAFFSIFFFITFMFNGGLIAHFLTMQTLGLFNTVWVLILPGIYSYWYMIIFRSYFGTLPASLEEAALIDGASYTGILVKIIVPLSKPVYATIGFLSAVAIWNEWFTGIFYIRNPRLIPLQTLLQRIMMEADMINQLRAVGLAFDTAVSVTPGAIRLAIVIITIAPIVMIYPLLQRYIIKGMLIGAVKG